MRSVTLKSAITPSFIGLIATMLPGVRPSISFASRPTASTSPVDLLMATIEGSFTTIPLPFAKTRVLAVPRSIARSDEKRLNSDRRFIWIVLLGTGDLTWDLGSQTPNLQQYHSRNVRARFCFIFSRLH